MANIQDSGSNYSFYDKKIYADVKKSKFDLSYINTFTANEGQLIPVWVQHTLPNEDYELSLQSLVRVVNPPVVPLMSRQRIFFHTYWASYSQLWKYFQVFMSRGVSGTKSLTIPRLGFESTAFERGSLLDYLGFPQTKNTSGLTYVNALPLMMYLRCFRDYYKNSNLDVDSTDWYPDNDEDFVLSFQGDKALGQTGTFLDNLVNPFNIRYRDYVDDYFTSARPFPMRGEIPTLDFSSVFGGDGSLQVGFDEDDFRLPLSLFGRFNSDRTSFSNSVDTSNALSSGRTDFNGVGALYNLDGGTTQTLAQGFPLRAFGDSTSSISMLSTITAEQLRQLFSQTLIMEKMARTNGLYGEFIQSFFDSKPKNALNFMPYYVGGTFTPIIYSEVLQTSEDSNTPLGTVGGKGISASDGFIGRFHTDDYGIFMTIMSIMPDTYYSQGVLRENLYQTQSDFYLPERAELGMQAIFQGELFFSGDDDEDYKLWAYQDRFDELRYRPNEVHGKVADPNNLSFSPYIQTRFFDSVPAFNDAFVSTENNINKSWLSATNEVPYIVQVKNIVQAIRPVPYRSIPSGLSG